MNIITKKTIDFRARMFTFLMFGGIGLAMLALVINLLTNMWESALFCGILMLLCVLILIFVHKSNKFSAAYWFTIIVLFMILCPIMFFVSGGYYSGMPAVFNLAILSTVLMLEGKKAILVSVVEILEYSAVCAIAYYHPELVTFYHSESEVLFDIVVVSSAIGILSSAILYFYLREHLVQQKKLEEQNQQLRRYDESKSTFLTTVAHEIKNPLNSINLHARDTYELLDEEPLDIDVMKENMQVIEKVVVRIDRIVVDLMDTVAIQQGRLALSLVPMRLAPLIKDVTATYFHKEHVNNNQLILDIDETLLPIKADHSRIMQVMMNLLSNAVRHTQNGTITVRLYAKENAQVICVEDTGSGMREEIRKKAFEGYVSESKEHWRHGIGLYVCHQIIEAHKGRIWIESKVGEGTRVFFLLPMVTTE